MKESVEMNFFKSVYEIVKLVPKGRVISYGAIANILGNPRVSRQVGWALHKNPQPYIIPCHRVVNKNGQVAENFAFGGGEAQKELLLSENIEFDDNNCVKKEFFIYTV
jgi:methylated-DNA-protein-cysteine methyltransferase-like protein